MATAYPTALDSFTNPTENDNLDTTGVEHHEQHANANDAIEALETKVGINNSADTNSLDYKSNLVRFEKTLIQPVAFNPADSVENALLVSYVGINGKANGPASVWNVRPVSAFTGSC
jgi:hypothetical protein